MHSHISLTKNSLEITGLTKPEKQQALLSHKNQRLSAIQNVLKPSKIALALAAVLSCGMPVIAQDSEDDLEQLEEIIVTGSRIVRRDFDAASPIVTVDSESFSQTSTLGVENALNKLPQFVPSQTQFTSGSLTVDATSTPGIASLNLRGLGSNRNLILIDGRRAQPSNALLVVDTNTIPSAAIDNVEIISGGASATYGADAIGGVVNFKLKRNFEGFNLSLKQSGTEQGGGEESQVSVLIGGNLDSGRGNVMLGLDYSSRNEIDQSDREFIVDGWKDPGTGSGSTGTNYARYRRTTANAPDQALVDSMFGASLGSDEGYFFNPYTGGAYSDVSLFTTGATGLYGYTGPTGAASGFNYGIYQPEGEPAQLKLNNPYLWLSTPLDRFSLFGRAHYDINDNMSVFTQVNYSRIEVDTKAAYAGSTGLWTASIPYDGREIPDQLAQLLDSRDDPTANWDLDQNLDFFGPRGTHNTTNVYQFMLGIEGSLGDTDWTYEAYASHGDTEVIAEMRGIPSLARYRAIVTAPNWGEGWSQSGPAAFTASCTSGIPVFGDFELSDDCRDALDMRLRQQTTVAQSIAEANFQGGLFDLPAGEVRAAVGISTRENSFSFSPASSADAQSVIDQPLGLFAVNETSGETQVKELYAEALVPLLSDIPGIQQLDWEIGARYSDYDTAGEIWTYKSLFDWTVNDSVRVRAGYQLANRAPNVAELFTGISQNVVGLTGADPCLVNTLNTWGNHADNPNRVQVQQLCIEIINNSDNDPSNDNLSDYALDPLSVHGPFSFNFPFERVQEQGNPDLENEEATTLTAGIVFNVGDVEAAIDWYSVEIIDAIETIDAFFVYNQCLEQNPSFTYNEWCQLITRYTTDGYRQTVDTPFSNVGAIETSGVDLQINWNTDLAGGIFGINAMLNYLIDYKTQQNASAPLLEHTGTLDQGGQFDYKINTRVSYLKDDWSVGASLRFLPSIDHNSVVDDPDTTLEGAGTYFAVDVSGSYQFTESLTVRGGIDNFLDTDPEVVGRDPGVTNAKGSTNAGYYDIIGRRYYLALDFNF